MRRYFYNDDFAWFDDWLAWGKPTFTMMKGELYDPSTHDLVPKESFKKQQLETKERLLKNTRERREKEMKVYDDLEKNIMFEIEELKKSLSP